MKATTKSRNALAWLATSVLVVAALLYAGQSRADGCGLQRDILVSADPLLATVRPADCATLMSQAPGFSWPEVRGAVAYTVVLTFPDGHSETRTTSSNWLAWDHAVPPGTYSWRVKVDGRKVDTGAPRSFSIS